MRRSEREEERERERSLLSRCVKRSGDREKEGAEIERKRER